MAAAVLAIHLIWIGWVIFGWLVARNRPMLRWFHLASLIYGIFIEVAPWPCPLTLLEQYFELRAGIVPYRGPFLVHYLDATVYPNIPDALRISLAVLVCGGNLYLHFRHFQRRDRRRVVTYN